MCLAQGPQRSDAGEARTRGPSVPSQALYHWATALPYKIQWQQDHVYFKFTNQISQDGKQVAVWSVTVFSCVFFYLN